MGTGSKVQPSVYDLSEQSLAAQAKFLRETHIVNIETLLDSTQDDQITLDNRKQLKDKLAAFKHNLVTDELKPIIQKHRVTEEEQKKLNEEDFFKKSKLFSMLKSLNNIKLTEEAVALFSKQEQLKEKLMELKALIHKLAEAEYAWQVAEAEAERMKYEEEMQQLMLDALDNMKKDSGAQWNAHQDEIDKIDERISVLHQERRRIIDEHIPEVRNAADSVFEKSKANDIYVSLNDVQKNLFAEKLIEARDKIETDKLRLPILREEIIEDKAKLKDLKQKRAELRQQAVENISASSQGNSNTEYRGLTAQYKSQRALNHNEELQHVDTQIRDLSNVIREKESEVSNIERNDTNIVKTAMVQAFGESVTARMIEKDPDIVQKLETHVPLKLALDKVEDKLKVNRLELHEEGINRKTHVKEQKKIETELKLNVEKAEKATSEPIRDTKSFDLSSLKRNKAKPSIN